MTENQLIIEHTPLVFTVLKTFKKIEKQHHEDCVQMGKIGLLKALRGYDKDKGQFSTYAWYCIRNSIQGYLNKNKVKYFKYKYEPLYENKNQSLWEYLPSTLNYMESYILSLVYEYNYNFTEINKELSITNSKKIHNKALAKVKANL